MWKYMVKRFLLMFPTLLGVAVLIFVLMRIVPGDIVELRLIEFVSRLTRTRCFCPLRNRALEYLQLGRKVLHAFRLHAVLQSLIEHKRISQI